MHSALFLNFARSLHEKWTSKPADQTTANALQQANILQNVSDAVIVTDLDFNIQSWNKSAEQMYGWRECEVIGRSAVDLLRPKYRVPGGRSAVLLQFAEAGVWTGEAMHFRRDDQMVDVFTSVTLLRDAAGKPTGAVAINRDISPLKQAEQHQLNMALERERIAMQQIFMSDVAHDIRTPLTAIKLSLYLMNKADNSDDQQRHKRNLETQTDRLEKLVNDLFDITRFDRASTSEYQIGRVDINDLLVDIIALQQPFIESRALTVTFEADDSLPRFLGDAFKLERALTNLVMNALNYTPERGNITLRTCVRERQINIEICDTGIGIPPDELPHIFERFYRADKARGTMNGGLGLGLPIAQRIIESHGGTITVDSEPGAGSTFTVKLPIMYSGAS